MMTLLLPLLMDPRRVTEGLSPGTEHPFAQPLILLGVLVGVGLIVFLIGFFLHQPATGGRRRHRHRHRRHRHDAPPDAAAPLVEIDPDARSSRHRRHRHSHTTRNPSLAETGGLPPKRVEAAGPSPDFPPQT